MEHAIVQQAIAFVVNYYGLEAANIAAQVDAIRKGGWQVTVWIGVDLYQRVMVALDGNVRCITSADADAIGRATI